jgi:hypothetical protein
LSSRKLILPNLKLNQLMKSLFLVITFVMMINFKVHSESNNRFVSCQSLDSTTLHPNGLSILTFAIDSKNELQNVTHVDSGGGKFIDGIIGQKFGKPNPGYENEPLVLMPWQNSQITTGNSYVGKFCQNSMSDQYYNRWIFIDREFLNAQKSSAFLLLFVSQTVSGTPGKLHDYVFSCKIR